MMLSKKSLLFTLVAIFILLGTATAFAKPDYVPQIPAGYEQSCNLCHTASFQLKELGQQFQKNGHKFPDLNQGTQKETKQQGASSGKAEVTQAKKPKISGYPVSNIKVNIDDNFSEVQGIVISGRSYIPVRDMMESFGAPVNWDNQNKSVTFQYDGNTVQLSTKTKVMTVNGRRLIEKNSGNPFDTGVRIVAGKTYLPVKSFLVDALGFDISGNTNDGISLKRYFGVLGFLRYIFK